MNCDCNKGRFKVGDKVRNKYSGAKGEIVAKKCIQGSTVYVVKYEKYVPDEVFEDALELIGLATPSPRHTRSGYDHDEIDQQLELDFQKVKCVFTIGRTHWQGTASFVGPYSDQFKFSFVAIDKREFGDVRRRFNDYVVKGRIDKCYIVPEGTNKKIVLEDVDPLCSYYDNMSNTAILDFKFFMLYIPQGVKLF